MIAKGLSISAFAINEKMMLATLKEVASVMLVEIQEPANPFAIPWEKLCMSLSMASVMQVLPLLD